MGDFPQLQCAIGIIDSMTRSDTDLGARALQLWKKLHNHDAASCVDLAIRERRAGSDIEQVEGSYCQGPDIPHPQPFPTDIHTPIPRSVWVIRYSNGTTELICTYLKEG